MVWYLDTGKVAPTTDSKKKEENIALNIPVLFIEYISVNSSDFP